MGTKFRIASAKDIDVIYNILTKAIKYMNDMGINQWDEIYPSYDTVRNDIRNKHLYKLLINNQIISFVVINNEQELEYSNIKWDYESQDIGVIHRLCVYPSFQGKGYGKLTILFAEKEMIKKGYSAVRLDAFSLNPYVLKLYESLGYKAAGEVVFRKGKFICYEKQFK